MSPTLVDFLTGGLAGLGWWGLLAVLLVATPLTIFAVTLYLHRIQAHRGVDFHPLLVHFFRFRGWPTTPMIPREWGAIHRKHYARVETGDDPHSPVTRGIGIVFWRGVELYRQARAQRADIAQYGRGTSEDWIERHLKLPVEHRARLSALLEARSHPAAERRHQRRQRCHEAQASGSAALPAHAARLKDYPPGTA